MKLSHVALAALALTGLAFLPSVSASQDGGRSRDAEQEEEAHEESPLAEHMQELNRALRGLRGVLKDDAAMLAKVPDLARLQAVVLESKELIPHKIEALEDAAQKATETAAYRKDMNSLLRGLLDIEEQFLAGDGDAAKDSLQALEKVKRPAHERFQERKGGR